MAEVVQSPLFQCLSTEIRLLIYFDLLANPKRGEYENASLPLILETVCGPDANQERQLGRVHCAILRTCRQAYGEALPFLYCKNQLLFSYPRHSRRPTLLYDLGTRACSLIKRLEIYTDRFQDLLREGLPAEKTNWLTVVKKCNGLQELTVMVTDFENLLATIAKFTFLRQINDPFSTSPKVVIALLKFPAWRGGRTVEACRGPKKIRREVNKAQAMYGLSGQTYIPDVPNLGLLRLKARLSRREVDTIKNHELATVAGKWGFVESVGGQVATGQNTSELTWSLLPKVNEDTP